ncbi:MULTISPECIES: hypothetical protein [unclassified Peribacillus]|uniref:hypothetical protein n=1 Tax=unclassified Peribacillus TaxID=2675266 RepID=UPI001914BD58|nr:MULTISPECIES: hypothetical protein [unclassified Peribacillus]MBK5446208.1 hypothetical protein [Peribacillus sp. TH24]MBK5502487.1 hypothetical protein [Peribacillus sp. TH14]WMX57594.1 hypothetical protein RE409_10455 [Peribacillus sp. R9-11]
MKIQRFLVIIIFIKNGIADQIVETATVPKTAAFLLLARCFEKRLRHSSQSRLQ